MNGVERFWSKVDKTGECWLWTGAKIEGYGSLTMNRKGYLAHRLSYEWIHGPIPKGMDLDHRCMVRNCVNPDHLRLATRAQNMQHRSGANSNSKSGIRGVCFVANRWRAAVTHNGITYQVGRFKTAAEAEAAVIAKRLELFTHNDVDRVTG